MATVTKQRIEGMAVSPGYSVVAWTALDSSNSLRISGNETLLFRGTGTITIVSVNDQLGRTKDITLVPGTEIAVVGPVLLIGFQQQDSTLKVNCTGTAEVAVLSLSR